MRISFAVLLFGTITLAGLTAAGHVSDRAELMAMLQTLLGDRFKEAIIDQAG